MMNPANIQMNRRMYAIRDDKQREFNTPVIIANDAVASRSFGDMLLKDKDGIMARHAGDFSLWYLGDFNAEKGAFISAEPHIVCRASDFVSSTPTIKE